MSVLLEEIVLDFEDVVEAQLIGKLDLLQGFHEDLLFVFGTPLVCVQGLGALQLVEKSELHTLLHA